MSRFYFEDAPVYFPARPHFTPYGEPTPSAKELSDRAVKNIGPKAYDVCVKKLRLSNVPKRGGVFPPAQWVLVWKELHGGVHRNYCSSDTGCIMVAEIALAKAVERGAKLAECHLD